MTTLDDALQLLRDQARPDQLEGMARFGMQVERRLGLSVPTLRQLARRLGRQHALALALWDTGIADAQLLAGMVAEPQRFTSADMDRWAGTMASWDVCDGACLNAFAASPLAWDKVAAWAPREPEFVRRAAFALLATLAVHDKAADDGRFVAALAHVEAAADDPRNFVKKAVSWALRGIGKRNAALHAHAMACARGLAARGSKPARWIAADTLRELRSAPVCTRLGVAA
jgi:3-methyladenine DNA glycosylase AlkD